MKLVHVDDDVQSKCFKTFSVWHQAPDFVLTIKAQKVEHRLRATRYLFLKSHYTLPTVKHTVEDNAVIPSGWK